MTWKPKYIELKQRAFEIADGYKFKTGAQGKASRRAIEELAIEKDIATSSVYRYLKSQNVPLVERLRDKLGRFR